VPRYDTVSFLSDYGLVDEFVGVVKGVIRSIAPHVTVLDITHGIAPHDLRAGSLALARSVQYLPPGIVLAIVDPTVGSDRRAVAVEVGEGEDAAVFLGPDNGLLSSGVAMTGGAARAVSLTNRDYHLDAPGPTFAGRDVFAPAAAHLCNGVDLTELGESVDPVTLLPGLLPIAQQDEHRIVAEVLWIDHFGNVQLNVDPDELALLGCDRVTLRYRDQARAASVAITYAEIRGAEVGLVVDSYGLVSIAADQQSAAAELKLRAGDVVSLEVPT
jgi:S-adenosylmethionine hydrolase